MHNQAVSAAVSGYGLSDSHLRVYIIEKRFEAAAAERCVRHNKKRNFGNYKFASSASIVQQERAGSVAPSLFPSNSSFRSDA